MGKNQFFVIFVAFVVTTAAATATATAQESLRERMLRAEDTRAASDAELAPLREGLASSSAAVRRQAVRAIGRLERAALIPLASRVLADPDATVRAEAANAVGQLAREAADVPAALGRLHTRARAEQDPRVWGVVAATLGRLPVQTEAHYRQIEDVLIEPLPAPAGADGAVRAGDVALPATVQAEALAGALEGLEALVRLSSKVATPRRDTVERLRATALLQGHDHADIVRARRLAWLALPAAGGVDQGILDAGVGDSDHEVRRLVMAAAAADARLEGRERILTRGIADAHPPVRYEAVRTWGRRLQLSSCAPIVRAVGDEDPHVSLLAIDLLGNGCPSGEWTTVLFGLVSENGSTWHRRAHALVAISKLAPAEARKLLPAAVAHATWQVRMYAAHAAGELAALDELDRLARDAHDNVREAALGELVRLRRPEAIPAALDALTRPDYQLVLTAARALGQIASADGDQASDEQKVARATALLAALARITKERRDTSRDPRMAILDRLDDLAWPEGTPVPGAHIEALQAFLADFDPRVAARAAEILTRWTRRPHAAAPRPLPVAPVSWDAVEALRGARLRWTMAGKGAFEMALLVDEAPLSVLRVATLARQGYYNGLTFHRVAPNFVIQGGSPGANEYMGDGPYMRDEVGLVSHRRGTVGISTRGRDTGDAQIFVNLIDSPRLDHTYTVFADIVSGLDVVDAVLEGDVIERVEVVPPAGRR